MSGEGKPPAACRSRSSALPRLYLSRSNGPKSTVSARDVTDSARDDPLGRQEVRSGRSQNRPVVGLRLSVRRIGAVPNLKACDTATSVLNDLTGTDIVKTVARRFLSLHNLGCR